MKVVHIVSMDTGGAARAALRINSALKSVGVDSSVLVLENKRTSADVYPILDSKLKKILFKCVRKITQIGLTRTGLAGKFYQPVIGFNISKMKRVKEADVINFHWINDGMLNFNSLKRLSKANVKMVWTLHDMFAFTGGCYYDSECGKYEQGCMQCPILKTSKTNDTFIRKNMARKSEIYRNADISFIGCSKWMSECAKKSILTRGEVITTIPNPIDTTVFRSVGRNEGMKEYGISTKKKIILFGAMAADSDPRKGFTYLKAALTGLKKEDYIAVVFGNRASVSEIIKGLETVGIGGINSDDKLVKLYSMADVFVAPSIQENLSNAVMESLACGTPVVAFNIGGMPDMIEHKINGYLAIPHNVVSLREGIEWAANNTELIERRCVKKVIHCFSMNAVGHMYVDFYRKIGRGRTNEI